MSTITITHTHQDGTLIDGSAKGDGVYEILKGLRDNWRYMPSIRRIGIGQSRDRNADGYKIKRAAEALRNAGHDVTVEVDESQRRSFAEAEAERAQRAENRAERYGERAERRGEQAQADYARARQMADVIPLGQPMMPDHYSYNRDRNYRAKIDRTYRRAFDGMDEAEELQRRAEAAETYQASRESVPVTLRRIAKLEAELRGVKRTLEGRLDYVSDGAGGYTVKRVMPSPGRTARLEQVATDYTEQIEYWRGVVAAAEASGVKVWGPPDFTKGDFTEVHGSWAEVLRVNPKSVTVAFGVNTVNVPVVTKANAGGSTWTLPYDKVTARKSAADMTAAAGPAA